MTGASRVPKLAFTSADREPLPDALDLQSIYEEHGAFVHSLLRRLLGPEGDADDLAQEVFLVAMRKLPSFTYGSPRIWLGKIAIHLASNARRLHRLKRVLRLTETDALVDWRTPDLDAEAGETALALYAVLDRLPEKKRTAFIMFEVQGLSCPEIAEVVGCSVQTVYTRLHYARRAFLEAFPNHLRLSGRGEEGRS